MARLEGWCPRYPSSYIILMSAPCAVAAVAGSHALTALPWITYRAVQIESLLFALSRPYQRLVLRVAGCNMCFVKCAGVGGIAEGCFQYS